MWAPGAVRRAVETFAANPDADVVSGECLLVNESGALTGLFPTGPFDLVRSVSKADHILNQPAVFMRRDALEAVGWLREMWLHDHDLWLRLGLRSRFVHLSEVLAYGRDRKDNLGRNARLNAPLRVKLIEDFVTRDDLTPELRSLKRQAMSWANIRAAHLYWTGRQGLWMGVRHLARAALWDPLNFFRVAVRRLRTALRAGMRALVGV
jgi:hypothetical protein